MIFISNIPLVATVNDISGYGRCSQTVSIPIISAMGIQVCPLITSLFSAHTGYKDYRFYDFTDHMENFINNWQELELKFDGIYTGFLGNKKQSAIISDFIDKFKTDSNIILVDPIIGDNGTIYPCFDEEMLKSIVKLVRKSTIITPNLTEACLITNTNYNELIKLDDENFKNEIIKLGRKLQNMSPNQVVITSVTKGNNKMQNVVFENNKIQFIDFERLDYSFSGTGDVFASLICGYLVNGNSLSIAVKKASDFIYEVCKYSLSQKNNFKNGIIFEPFLNKLF